MNTVFFLLCGILAFSAVSSLLYVLPMVADRLAGAIGTDSKIMQQKRDKLLKHLIGVMSVITAIFALICFCRSI
jgi:hypothetical protein